MLLEAAVPGRSLDRLELLDVAPRLKKHVQDLVDLHAAIDCILPPSLLPIHQMLHAPQERVVRVIRVYHVEAWPRLNPWQRELIGHLNASKASSDGDVTLKTLLDSASVILPGGRSDNALRFLQKNLFTLETQKKPIDESIQGRQFYGTFSKRRLKPVESRECKFLT